MTNEHPRLVDITDVVPEAIKGYARDLETGDYVFDAQGDRYKLAKVQKFKKTVNTVRADGWPDTWAVDDEITYVKGQAE